MTYLLEGLRALVMTDWKWGDIGGAVAAIVGVGIVSQALAFGALRSRVRQR